MQTLRRPVVKELLLSAVCVGVAVMVVVSFDSRVHERFTLGVERASSGGVSVWVGEIQSVAGAVALAVRDQSLEHAPLLVFSVIAGVLFLCMLRM
jgi:hypothetical protein